MNYERRRSKNRGPNEKWISNKYDLQGIGKKYSKHLQVLKERMVDF